MKNSWQKTEEILRLFGKRRDSAQRAYRIFVEEGIEQGKRNDLAGGGLIRSAGGWEALKAKREEGHYQRSDERILGDSNYVELVLAQMKETVKKSYVLHAAGIDLDKIARRVSQVMNIKAEDVWSAGKQQHIVNARSLFCFWAVRELEVSMASLARDLGLSIPAISKSVIRGKHIAEGKDFKLIES